MLVSNAVHCGRRGGDETMWLVYELIFLVVAMSSLYVMAFLSGILSFTWPQMYEMCCIDVIR